jgi:hypothetical protein
MPLDIMLPCVYLHLIAQNGYIFLACCTFSKLVNFNYCYTSIATFCLHISSASILQLNFTLLCRFGFSVPYVFSRAILQTSRGKLI